MILVRNLSKTYKTKDKKTFVLNNINLKIKKGEFISIIGPSGCGKSTLLKLIGGLLNPTKGEVKINDESLNSENKKNISTIFQNPVLLPWRNVKQNISLPLELRKETSHNVNNVLNLVKLESFEKYYPFELSGGMQQKVSIARALSFEPEILLMDEPFGALDEIARNNLNQSLLEIWRKLNLTIIFVTHSITEAVYLSDRVIILSKRPATVKADVKIDLPRPRTISGRETPKFQRHIKCIREKIE